MTAQGVLDRARSQLGTVESPPNSNRTKYGAAYGLDGNAWCAMFVWWCFREAGDSGLIPKAAYTPSFADWFRKRGQWGSAPRPGAVVFFDFPNDGVNRISHVGIVEAVGRDGSITTIEGNTSSGTGGSQRDGGGVYRRTRKGGSTVGYGYPAYSGIPPVVRDAEAGRWPTIRRGSTGTAVQTIQRFLGVVGPGGSGYGTFGPQTEAAVVRYQRMRGLQPDGVVGNDTWKSTGL